MDGFFFLPRSFLYRIMGPTGTGKTSVSKPGPFKINKAQPSR